MNSSASGFVPAISLEEVHKSFGGTRAVDGVTFDVAPGTIVGLIGPNGAGKTTLFNVINGFCAADFGRVTCYGKDISHASAYARVRAGIGRTFQDMRIIGRLSAVENVMLADADATGEMPIGAIFSRWNVSDRHARNRAMALLRDLDLIESAEMAAADLSYGQRKLLTVACACSTGARVLLLDEPVAGVNPTLKDRLLGVVEQVRKEEGRTVLMIEHNMDVVMRISDRVIVMCNGKVIADGTPSDVRDDAVVIEAYLS